MSATGHAKRIAKPLYLTRGSIFRIDDGYVILCIDKAKCHLRKFAFADDLPVQLKLFFTERKKKEGGPLEEFEEVNVLYVCDAVIYSASVAYMQNGQVLSHGEIISSSRICKETPLLT